MRLPARTVINLTEVEAQKKALLKAVEACQQASETAMVLSLQMEEQAKVSLKELQGMQHGPAMLQGREILKLWVDAAQGSLEESQEMAHAGLAIARMAGAL
jgi:hypothetical protein